MTRDESGNLGTWNAWTENRDGTTQLFVEGELEASAPEGDVRLVKAQPQGSDERDLLLTLTPCVQLENPGRTLKLTYSETVRDGHQYASITITDQGSAVARIVTIGHREPA